MENTLTYQGKVDPQPGTYMGPGMNGKIWQVLGSVYDEASNTTKVSFDPAE